MDDEIFTETGCTIRVVPTYARPEDVLFAQGLALLTFTVQDSPNFSRRAEVRLTTIEMLQLAALLTQMAEAVS